MDPVPDKVDRDATTPFLLKLYCRTGAFHRPDEFSSPTDLPPHVALHTWSSATLGELTQQLAAASPRLLPSPAIGTRVAFRLVYRDVRVPHHPGSPPVAADTNANANAHAAPSRLATQDLGSVVIGDGGPGAALEDEEQQQPEMDGLRGERKVASTAEAARTLADARFVVGDFLSVAILPPSSVDGSVQPASAARTGRGYGVGQASSPVEGPLGRVYGGYGHGHGHGHSRGGLGSRMGGAGGGGYGREGGQIVPPVGEWRRGERLPDVPAPPSRGRGGGRRRW